jgi:2-polyprenyl-6-methoxyphenol hydroxylase-like FAD-dependent oxidoreductase
MRDSGPVSADAELDVLVVGAGPTGLALAAQLSQYRVRFRIVDAHLDRVHESRALAVQPRTLEVLAPLGVTGEMVERGNPAVTVRLHTGRGSVAVALGDIGVPDTAYPFLLFLSQAETERILDRHLQRAGVAVERGVRLDDADLAAAHPTCRLRHGGGRVETVTTRYVVGCDGAHSTVRQQAGIEFRGAAYPQSFVLADLEVDGLHPGEVHAYLTGPDILFFFPLGAPAAWRMLGIRPTDNSAGEVTLPELQGIVDARTPDRLRLRDPEWMTDFRIHLRGAARYRSGPVFLAGDAAHIHSPAGGQGMNTGIQDAVNLGWKLGLVASGQADPALLDTYETERAPVGRAVLRFTNRLFTLATTRNPVARVARTRLVPVLAPLPLRSRALRAAAFRTISELAIGYRHSPASVEGRNGPRRGPRAGDRLPDAIIVHNGHSGTLHVALAGPGYHLLLCGRSDSWPADASSVTGWVGAVTAHRLSAEPGPGVLHDKHGTALRRLGLDRSAVAHYVIRPDGHVGYRAGGADLAGAHAYLSRWLRRPPGSTEAPA